MWEGGEYRTVGLGEKARDLCFLSLPLTTAAHAPQPLGAAQSPPWSCLAVHRYPPGPSCNYPAPGQHALKAVATVAVAAVTAVTTAVAAAAATAAAVTVAVAAAVTMTAAVTATVTAAAVAAAAAAAVVTAVSAATTAMTCLLYTSPSPRD